VEFYFLHEGTCPIRDILSRLGDKWSLLALVTLSANGTMRFSGLLAVMLVLFLNMESKGKSVAAKVVFLCGAIFLRPVSS
jgi:hypothetical protein